MRKGGVDDDLSSTPPESTYSQTAHLQPPKPAQTRSEKSSFLLKTALFVRFLEARNQHFLNRPPRAGYSLRNRIYSNRHPRCRESTESTGMSQNQQGLEGPMRPRRA